MLLRSWVLLILFSLPIISITQDYSTWGEIYDFDVGDIFHFDEWCSGPGGGNGYNDKTNIEILERTYSADSNTVTYVQFVRSLYSDPVYPNGVYSEFYDTVTYENLNSLFIADTTYSSSIYNGRKISYQDLSVPIYWVEWSEYVDGCGFAHSWRDQIQLPAWCCERELKYFKKGDEQWGTPIILTSVDDVDPIGPVIELFPNPAITCSVTIKSNLQISRLDIYNNLGSNLQTKRSAFHQIDISTLPGGLYVVVISGDDWQVNRKLIIQ